jgi:hypothetical protein
MRKWSAYVEGRTQEGMTATSAGKPKMPIYEVTYSTKTASSDESSFSDVILVEAETHEELYAKVVDTLLHTLGPSGNYYVDSIRGDPYGPGAKKRITKKTSKDQDIVNAINALISKRNRGP